MPKKEKTLMEKHFQSVLLSLCTFGIMWMIMTTKELDKSMGLVKFQLDQITAQSSNYFTKEQAESARKFRDEQMKGIDQRLTRVEALIEARGTDPSTRKSSSPAAR